MPGNLRELYDLLVKPADPQLAPSERILIAPDGPLHTLPFAALRREREYLIEWKPLHTVISATVYAELKNMRRPRNTERLELAAFGAPQYPRLEHNQSAKIGDLELRSAVDRGLDLSPLPYSREEVNGITTLFPGRSQKFLDADATEDGQSRSANRRGTFTLRHTASLMSASP